jgi:hypothetical protein
MEVVLRRVVLSGIAALVLLLPVHAAETDPLAWRDFLSPSDWKSYKQTLDVFIDASAFAAHGKTACKMPMGSDAEDQFLTLLTGTNLLRPGIETVVPRQKWRAWQHLLTVGCDRSSLSGAVASKRRWFTELQELQVRGLKNMIGGGRRYR